MDIRIIRKDFSEITLCGIIMKITHGDNLLIVEVNRDHKREEVPLSDINEVVFNDISTPLEDLPEGEFCEDPKMMHMNVGELAAVAIQEEFAEKLARYLENEGIKVTDIQMIDGLPRRFELTNGVLAPVGHLGDAAVNRFVRFVDPKRKYFEISSRFWRENQQNH